MAYTITITKNTPQALAFIKEAKKLDFVKVTKTKETKAKDKAPAKTKEKAGLSKPARVLTPKEKEFKKMLLQGLKEMKAIREGKMKAGNLDDLLNEL